MPGQLRMKAIKPKGINEKAMLAELTAEMKSIQDGIYKDFEATTKTWDNKPTFERELQTTPNRIRAYVWTVNEIYGYVSGGTKPHRIMPKRGKVLRFAGTYRAKTSPGTIGSSSGGSSGADVFSRGVKHPGTKARNFPEAIEKKWHGPFQKRMGEAMDRAVKKSGHEI